MEHSAATSDYGVSKQASNPVFIVGTGIVPFTAQPQAYPPVDLAASALRSLQEDFDGKTPAISQVYFAGPPTSLGFDPLLSTHLPSALGLGETPCMPVAGGTIGGSIALQAAARYLAGHPDETILVLGVSRILNLLRAPETGLADTTLILKKLLLSPGEEALYPSWITPYSLLVESFLLKHGLATDALHAVTARNRAAGVNNPIAALKVETTTAELTNAAKVSGSHGALDLAPLSDGAVALLLAGAQAASTIDTPKVRITGCGSSSIYPANALTAPRKTTDADSSGFPVSRQAWTKASTAAGLDLTATEETVALELDDRCAGLELMAATDLGLPTAQLQTLTAPTGSRPTNLSGGYLSLGMGGSAQGLAKASELYTQLSDAAGARQVKQAKTGVLHEVEGLGIASYVTVFAAE